MNKSFQAVYESGVLKPLEPLPLAEHQIVTLVVAEDDGRHTAVHALADELLDVDALAIAEREGEGAVTLEQLHELLKSIPGSMSDVVIAERGEY